MKFKNFTSQGNCNFKMAFKNGLVVSIAKFDHDGTESFDENDNMIDFSKEFIHTYNMSDMAIFNQNTGKNMTKYFCKDFDNFDEWGEEVIYVEPEQISLILQKVSEWEG